MDKYFSLDWVDDDLKSGIAFAPEGTALAHDLVDEIKNLRELPFNMKLKDGGLQDFQANSLAWPLVSKKMKVIISNNLTGNEGIEWVLARIENEDKMIDYYIPKFRQKLDVLDPQQTIFVKGTDQIIIPYFSVKKIKDLALFHKPTSNWRITPDLFVHDKLRKELMKNEVSGVEFKKARVV